MSLAKLLLRQTSSMHRGRKNIYEEKRDASEIIIIMKLAVDLSIILVQNYFTCSRFFSVFVYFFQQFAVYFFQRIRKSVISRKLRYIPRIINLHN